MYIIDFIINSKRQHNRWRILEIVSRYIVPKVFTCSIISRCLSDYIQKHMKILISHTFTSLYY